MTSDHNEKPGERNGNAKPGVKKRRKVTLKDVEREYRANLAEANGALFTSNELKKVLERKR